VTGPSRFGFEELGPTEVNELDDALEAVSALELAAEDAPVRTGPAFTERVMAALADEPAPGSVGFLLPLRRRGPFLGFIASVRQAWTSIGTGRPTFARAAALAYVLVVAIAGTSLVGAASFGAADALGLLEPHATPQPTTPPSMPPGPTPVLPTPSAEPEPSETPEAAEPSDDHGGGGEPEASDDHGGNSGPGGGGGDDGSGGSDDGSGPSASDDHSGGGSDDDSGSDDGSGSSYATPRPTDTPKPSETPH
jgi:hypothetical protein